MLNMRHLEQEIARQMAAARVPGFALAIVQEHEIVYARGFGVTGVEDAALPITPDTLFCSGSISKSLTGTAIMRLVEQGVLDLDTPVTVYAPDLAYKEPSFTAEVTLRRLLSHTAGLYGTAGNFGPSDPGSLTAFIHDALPRADFVAPPGRVFEYCNLGIDLAGYVAEVVTGQPFADLMRALVFVPLGMERTTYDRTIAMTYPVALAHTYDADGTARVLHRMFANAAGNPAGFVMASTLDLARFARMLVNGGRIDDQQFLSPASVALMQRRHAQLHDADGRGYGLTLWTMMYKGREWVGHAGLLTPYQCEFVVYPREGLAIVSQCNATGDFDPAAVRRSIVDRLLDLPDEAPALERRVVTPDRASWSRHVGTYLSLAGGQVTIAVADDRLILERDEERVPLDAISDSLYASADGTITIGFIAEEAGPTQYFMLDEHAYGRVTEGRAEAGHPATLEVYSGAYLFDDGDTARLRVADGCLYVTFSWISEERRCMPLDNRRFASRDGVFELHPSPDGPLLVCAGFIVAKRIADAVA